MNHLKCAVATCLHNQNRLCELRKIHVDGPGATVGDETCCASYVERTARTENAAGCGCMPESKTEIHCSAHHCVYNNDKTCRAENVSVGCLCEHPCAISDTSCCTFAPKQA